MGQTRQKIHKPVPMKHLLIDYGGTFFRYAVVSDLTWRLHPGRIQKLQTKQIDIERFLAQHIDQQTASVRIAFAGQVQKGKILSSPNTGAGAVDLAAVVKKCNPATGLYLDNDLNCAARAEYAANKHDHLLVLYLGTGLGGAFVHGGRVLAGANALGVEIGHIPYKKTPFHCACGRDDCVELSCGGEAIKKWCNRFDINFAYTGLKQLQQARSEAANTIVQNVYEALSHALQTALALFDPGRVVLGGSVFTHNLDLVEFCRKECEKSPFARHRKIQIVQSTLQEGSLEGTRYL